MKILTGRSSLAAHRLCRIHNYLSLNIILTRIITSDLLSDELHYSARLIYTKATFPGLFL